MKVYGRPKKKKKLNMNMFSDGSIDLTVSRDTELLPRLELLCRTLPFVAIVSFVRLKLSRFVCPFR